MLILGEIMLKPFFILSITFFVFAVQAPSRAFAEGDLSTPEETLDAVVEAVKDQIQTLDHDVFVYHYRERTTSDSVKELRKDAAAIYTRYVQKTVYGPAPVYADSMLGNGLYAAIDPFSSREYGGSDWLLFQFRLARGSRYWDVTRETLFSEPLIEALNRHFHCVSRASWDMVSGGESCHSVRRQILGRLNVTAILYEWGNYLAPTICNEGPRNAFYFTNLTPFRKEDIQVFGESYFPFGDGRTESRRILESIVYFSLRTTSAGMSYRNRKKSELWPILDPIGPFEDRDLAKARALAKKNLFGCE